MYKVIAMIKRRQDLTPEQFRDHYEGKHIPLVIQHIGDIALSHTRNYIETALASLEKEAAESGNDWSSLYDCVMEIALPDKDALERMFTRIGQPDIEALFVEDEARFVDRGASRIFICESRESPMSG